MIVGGVLFVAGWAIIVYGGLKALKGMGKMVKTLDVEKGFGNHLSAMGITLIGGMISGIGVVVFLVTLASKALN